MSKKSEYWLSAKLVYIWAGKVTILCRCKIKWLSSNNLTQIINIHKKHSLDVQTKAVVLNQEWREIWQFLKTFLLLQIVINDFQRVKSRKAANPLTISEVASHTEEVLSSKYWMIILKTSELQLWNFLFLKLMSKF